MIFELRKGNVAELLTLPDDADVTVLRAKDVALNADEESVIKDALRNPVGSARLCEIVKENDSVAIIVSDITRPVKSSVILPYIIEEIKHAGVKDDGITVVLALGSHRSHTEAEKRYIIGDAIFERFQVVDSDPDRCRNIGTCKNGTPVDIFEPVFEADRVICTGNVEYHYFAGYSGGAKAVMPGVSSREAIRVNHANMLSPEAVAGNMDGNPVREDIDEAGRILGIDFIFNVIQDDRKRIIRAYAGDMIAAHRAACAELDAMCRIRLGQKADIVVVSPGGFPKDINLYQAQKSLDNAVRAVRKGGAVILCASCGEGFGNSVFEDWMLHMTREEMRSSIRENFVLGGHKAAAIASAAEHATIYMVTDMDMKSIEGMGFKCCEGVQQAFDMACHDLGGAGRIIVMPEGGRVLPD